MTTVVGDPPAAATPGGSISVSDSVMNQGSLASGLSTTRYYLSLETFRDGAAILLSRVRSVPAVTPGATSSHSMTVAIPSTTPGGSYYLLACSDDLGQVREANEANSCMASASTTVITP